MSHRYLPILFLVGCTPAPAGETFRFPASDTLATSPDGQQTVIWREARDTSEHQLLVRRNGDSSRALLSFGRHIDGSWSPSRRYLAITDAHGSGDDRLLLVDVETSEILATIPSDSTPIPSLVSPEPTTLQIADIHWVDSTLLTATLSGAREEKSFTYLLRYRLGHGILPP